MLVTSPTQTESHSFVQQKLSIAQIWATQSVAIASQPEVSCSPTSQGLWLQLPADPGQLRSLHVVSTRSTQNESQASSQQNGSTSQIWATQSSQPGSSGSPSVQRPWGQTLQVEGDESIAASRAPA